MRRWYRLSKRIALGMAFAATLFPSLSRARGYQVSSEDVRELNAEEQGLFLHGTFPPTTGCSTTLQKFTDGSVGILTAAHCFSDSSGDQVAHISLDGSEQNRVPVRCTSHPKWRYGEPCTGDAEQSPPDIMVCKFETPPQLPSQAKAACLSPKPPEAGENLTIIGAGGQPGKRPPDFYSGTTEVKERKGVEILMSLVTEPGDSGGFLGKMGEDGAFRTSGVISGGSHEVSCATDIHAPEVKSFVRGQGLLFCGETEGDQDKDESDDDEGMDDELDNGSKGSADEAKPHAKRPPRERSEGSTH